MPLDTRDGEQPSYYTDDVLLRDSLDRKYSESYDYETLFPSCLLSDSDFDKIFSDLVDLSTYAMDDSQLDYDPQLDCGSQLDCEGLQKLPEAILSTKKPTVLVHDSDCAELEEQLVAGVSTDGCTMSPHVKPVTDSSPDLAFPPDLKIAPGDDALTSNQYMPSTDSAFTIDTELGATRMKGKASELDSPCKSAMLENSSGLSPKNDATTLKEMIPTGLNGDERASPNIPEPITQGQPQRIQVASLLATVHNDSQSEVTSTPSPASVRSMNNVSAPTGTAVSDMSMSTDGSLPSLSPPRSPPPGNERKRKLADEAGHRRGGVEGLESNPIYIGDDEDDIPSTPVVSKRPRRSVTSVHEYLDKKTSWALTMVQKIEAMQEAYHKLRAGLDKQEGQLQDVVEHLKQWEKIEGDVTLQWEGSTEA